MLTFLKNPQGLSSDGFHLTLTLSLKAVVKYSFRKSPALIKVEMINSDSKLLYLSVGIQPFHFYLVSLDRKILSIRRDKNTNT